MAESSIPVDLFNPGQVFACLGFLEAADILCGDAEGGFDWSDESDEVEVKFRLAATGEQNPVEAVLKFLAEAEIVTVCPAGIKGSWPDNAEQNEEFPAPCKGLTASLLPVRLQRGNASVQISHWLKGNVRQPQPFKLFAGQQVGAQLMRNMLCGDPKKKASEGFKDIFCRFDERAFQDPFGKVCAVGGRFGFDARGGWDALGIGTSLNKQGVLLKIAPHVELLAAMGLENARPTFLSTYEIRYAAWDGSLPVTLCRAALCAPHTLLPKDRVRFFRAHLGEDGQYKKCFFAEQETTHD